MKIYDISLLSSEQCVSLHRNVEFPLNGEFYSLKSSFSEWLEYGWLKSNDACTGAIVFEYGDSRTKGSRPENKLNLDSQPITRYNYYIYCE